MPNRTGSAYINGRNRALFGFVCPLCGARFNSTSYHAKYCSIACRDKSMAKEQKNDVKDKDGYVMCHRPSHPLACKSGFIRRCRLVAADAYGVDAVRGMSIHHINEVVDDDRVANLLVLTRAEHVKVHSPTISNNPGAIKRVRDWHLANAHRLIRNNKGRIVGMKVA